MSRQFDWVDWIRLEKNMTPKDKKLEDQRFAHIAHAAGFLDGLALRLESFARWEQGNIDTASLKVAADDCRDYARSLRMLVGIKID